MLAFLTLLLGIVVGPRTIDLGAPAGAASVEVLLDGERVGERRAPPWTFVVDFGAVPAPHHLDAIARDARGGVIGRVRQRVNVPRPEAEAVLALLPGSGGTGRLARLRWEAPDGEVARSVALSFDGRPLAAPDPEHIELPPFVPERLHFLRADVELERGVRAQAELAFGGRDRDETERELTAVPLRVRGGKLPVPESMKGWILAAGETPRIVAAEEGDASIVFVLDIGGPPAFERIDAGTSFPIGSFWHEPEVRTLLAYARPSRGPKASYDVYARSFPAYLERGLLHVLAGVDVSGNELSCPRLADAAGVAGLLAAAWSHPRAVVVVSSGEADASSVTPAAARSYLADLGVPLFVWVVPPAAPEALASWGGGRVVRTRADFRAAFRELEEAVDDQRIVWIDGAYLPQSISLGPAAPPGVAIAR